MQAALQIPSRINSCRQVHHSLTLKNKRQREKSLKPKGEKKMHYLQRRSNKMPAEFSTETMKPQYNDRSFCFKFPPNGTCREQRNPRNVVKRLLQQLPAYEDVSQCLQTSSACGANRVPRTVYPKNGSSLASLQPRVKSPGYISRS